MDTQMLIVDLGSQYTLLIGRQIRELGVRSLILPPSRVEGWLTANTPKGIILSGGADSVYDPDALLPPKTVLEQKCPILGICFGMHWIAQACGGRVEAIQEQRGYGKEELILVEAHNPLFHQTRWRNAVWMSHGDSVTKLPKGFYRIAETEQCPVAAMGSDDGTMWGVQFHPEVKETEYGTAILWNFLRISGAEPDWVPTEVAESIREEVQRSVPPGTNCLLAFSGGVDSTTVAAIVAPVLGSRLTCVTLDTGGLREGELAEITANVKAAGCHLSCFDRQAAFLEAVAKAGVDAEAKRRAFQGQYVLDLETLAAEADARILIQGTLAPDRIESGGVGRAATIKTHHNVGIGSWLEQLHPLRDLYKYEVRDLARHLGLPPSVTERKPFPGPGLYCRIIGIPVTAELLDTVRWADAEVRHIIAESGIEGEFAQLVVALIGARTVGVKGDGRSYGYAIAVRAVQTSDFMTCRGYQFPAEVRRHIQRALTKHREVTRVWFDENDKPPATVEFE